MSADLLRQAATILRADWPTNQWCPEECNCNTTHVMEYHPMAEEWNAVADWLDAEAGEIPPGATHYRDSPIGGAPAVRLARLIAGGDA